MPNHRIKPGETADEARLRFNAEVRAYRQLRKDENRPLNARSPEKVWENGLWKKYKMTPDDWYAMRAHQDNSCLICATKFRDVNIQHHAPDNCCVDHCHSTGKIRGLLCSTCNLGIGYFRDRPAVLRKAADYLELLA